MEEMKATLDSLSHHGENDTPCKACEGTRIATADCPDELKSDPIYRRARFVSPCRDCQGSGMDWASRATLVAGPERVADLVSRGGEIKTVDHWHEWLSDLLLNQNIHPQTRIDYIIELKSLYEFMHDDQRRDAQYQATMKILVSFGLDRLILDRASDDEYGKLFMLIQHLVLS